MVLDRLGQKGLYWLDSFGDYTRFLFKMLYWMVRGPGKFARRQMWGQMFEIGTRSIPVVAVTGGFIGAVLAIEAYAQFLAIGQEARLGSIINISVVKQIGPVLTAVMLAGRVGGSLTAELGTMRVTEQIDALRAMASDPIRTVAVPRFAACLIMMPALTIFSDWVGVLGGWFMCVKVLGVNSHDYMYYATSGLDMFTVNTGLLKSLFFGAAIASVACYKGFNCGSGAQGVGRACTDAFVLSFVAILVMNFFLAVAMNKIYMAIWPNSSSVFG